MVPALALFGAVTVILLLTELSACIVNHPDCDSVDTLIPPTTTAPLPPGADDTTMFPTILLCTLHW